MQFHCIGRGASKVVYKGFDEVEGIEVAWNEVSCSDWVLGRCVVGLQRVQASTPAQPRRPACCKAVP